MSSLSDKFNVALEFESGALLDDSSGNGHTFTNINGITGSGGVAMFVADNAQRAIINANDDVNLGGRSSFYQMQLTFNTLENNGATLWSQDDGGDTRVQWAWWSSGMQRIIWETWTADHSVNHHTLVLDQPVTTDVDYTVQLWQDQAKKFGRLHVSGVTSPTYSSNAPAAGWDSILDFLVGGTGSGLILFGYFLDADVDQFLISHTDIPTAAERDWMIDKSWTEILSYVPTINYAAAYYTQRRRVA
jgi:hypothetical protein